MSLGVNTHFFKCCKQAWKFVGSEHARFRERIATSGERCFDLRLRDDRSRDRCTHEVAAFIDSTRESHGEREVVEELAFEIHDDAGGSAGALRLLFNAIEFAIALPNIRNSRNDFALVVFAKPRNDAGGVESAGVRDANLLGVGH